MTDPFSYHRELIRNFCIIAHIDHGKSTLADRLLEFTGAVEKREMQEQLLDDMDLEREKGITIKAHPVTMRYKAQDGLTYTINFIDTPGHVDFSFEVFRSLSACEGALLVVDATQGVQAQTIANVNFALDRGITVIPVINKIDLPASNPDAVKSEIEEIIGLPSKHACLCSAKSGIGIEEVLEEIVFSIPAPPQPDDDRLRGRLFDSHYDVYRGVMLYMRVFSGSIRKGTKIRLMASEKDYEVTEVGIFAPKETPVNELLPGQVGYILANIKNPSDVQVGETVTSTTQPISDPLPGFKKITPVVFAGLFPVDNNDFESLRDALKKLQLNDSSLEIAPESSGVLGSGFRIGFLGLLHLEIVFERLQREFDLDVITTSPSVSYHIYLHNGEMIVIDNPARFPDPSTINKIEEPWIGGKMILRPDDLGAVLALINDKRGMVTSTDSLDSRRLILHFKMPLNEIITDFNDLLKSSTQGYGSFDYDPDGFAESDIVKLEIRVNEEPVEPFSVLVHRSKAEHRGRTLCARLKDLIPQQQFKIPVQAAIGGKIVARETINALQKNVTAKCYGGDISRKRKLWEKQKKGKAKMKEFGKVHIPQQAFIDILKQDPG